ncbi:acyl-CoA N-acyltransferase [Hyaloraphidium curvatum]|nr:acyl-CoA N-acyltransferase [Hyaloraphidium curvatum]
MAERPPPTPSSQLQAPGSGTTVRAVALSTLPSLVPILRLTEEQDDVLERVVAERVREGGLFAACDATGETVGAATVDFDMPDGEAELLHLAVAEAHQGKGAGVALVRHVVEEAKRRGKKALLVGTADCAIDNIRFYLRRGFRMDHIEQDFFPKRYGWKPGEEVYENGIPMLDAIYFRMSLEGGTASTAGDQVSR